MLTFTWSRSFFIGFLVILGIHFPSLASPSTRDCPKGDTWLTNSPVTLNKSLLQAIIPLGNLNPSDHTLPTRHIYFYPTTDMDTKKTLQIDIHSPSYLEVVGALYDEHDQDWTLYLKPCKDVMIYIDHVKKLSDQLSDTLNSPLTASTSAKTLQGKKTITIKSFSFIFSAGQIIGQAQNFNIGLQDRRKAPNAFVNPERYDVDDAMSTFNDFKQYIGVFSDEMLAKPMMPLIAPQSLFNRCPLDYFVPDVKNELLKFLSDYTGAKPAVGCGSHMKDIAGTAQGNWFRDLEPSHDALFKEQTALALVNWNIDDATPLFSFNDKFPGIHTAVFSPKLPKDAKREEIYSFTPAASSKTGKINQRFANVKNNEIYCYQDLKYPNGARMRDVVFLQLINGSDHQKSQLRIEIIPRPFTQEVSLKRMPCDDVPAPWSFSNKATTFYR